MARVITFFPKQVYMGAQAGPLTVISEIFELSEENELLVELRVHGSNPSSLSLTGQIETTSDSTFVDSAWKQAGSNVATTSLQTGTVTGLQRYVRAKLTVPTTGWAYAGVNAVARRLAP